MKLFSLRLLILSIGIISLFFTTLPVAAATPEVKKVAPAAWVEQIAVEPDSDLPMDEIQNGQYHLLVDKQIRVAANIPTEYYRHYAIQVVNASGMEAASQISIDFDPEYQTVNFHKLRIRRGGKNYRQTCAY